MFENSAIEKITFRRIGKYALEQGMVLEPEDEEVVLYVNPQQISITRRKVIQRVMTNTRWVFQHWGLEPFVIQCRGSTGYLMNAAILRQADGDPEAFARSVYESQAYKALKRLKEFYTSPEIQKFNYKTNSLEISQAVAKVLVEMTYRDTAYIGFFSSFQLAERETSPWAWDYAFEFVAPVAISIYDSSAAADDLIEEARTQLGVELGMSKNLIFKRLQ